MTVEQPDEVLPSQFVIPCLTCGVRMQWKGGGFRFEGDRCIETARYACTQDETQATLTFVQHSPRSSVSESDLRANRA